MIDVNFSKLSRSQMREIIGGADQFQAVGKPCGTICKVSADCNPPDGTGKLACVSCDVGKGCS